jgi:hypothetical protein
MTLEEAFRETLLAGDQVARLPTFNERQRLFIVAEEIHPRVEQVARYLRERGTLDIYCVTFSVFQAASGELLVNVDTVVGEPDSLATPVVNRQQTTSTTGATWSGVKTASETIYETVSKLLERPGKETFAPSEVYYEILKTHPDFNQGTNNAQIIADCVNCPSRRHYPGRHPDRYFKVGRGTYRLYDPQTDGQWDQEGNSVV